MTITADTWAVVAATGLGPIAAVGLTIWRSGVDGQRARRMHVFRTLMATRRSAISNDHVNALNLIEVEFYRVEAVEQAWRAYIGHLNNKQHDIDPAWDDERERLLAKLLHNIGSVLRYKIESIEIYRGGYAPQGWAHRDARQLGIAEYLHQLSTGTNVVPLWIKGVTRETNPATDAPNTQ